MLNLISLLLDYKDKRLKEIADYMNGYEFEDDD